MDRGIGSWATKRAFLSGDRTALVDDNRRITFTQLDERTNRLARALRALGVRKGDRVGGLLINSPAFIETMLAAAKLGAIFVPMNVRLAPAEVAYQLADSGADVLVYSNPLAPVARAAVSEDGVRVRHQMAVGGECLAGELSYDDVVNSEAPTAVGSDVAGHDIANLMYTSG